MNDDMLRQMVVDCADRLDDVELASVAFALIMNYNVQNLRVWPYIASVIPSGDLYSKPEVPPIVKDTFIETATARAEEAVAKGKPRERELVRWMTTDASSNALTPKEEAALLRDISYIGTNMGVLDDWRFLLMQAALRGSISPVVRAAAVKGLIGWGSKAIKILTDVMQHDPFPEIRQEAADGLETISQSLELEKFRTASKEQRLEWEKEDEGMWHRTHGNWMSNGKGDHRWVATD